MYKKDKGGQSMTRGNLSPNPTSIKLLFKPPQGERRLSNFLGRGVPQRQTEMVLLRVTIKPVQKILAAPDT